MREVWDLESNVPFGKYVGRPTIEIVEEDPAYLEWFIYCSKVRMSEELIIAIEEHLEEPDYEAEDQRQYELLFEEEGM